MMREHHNLTGQDRNNTRASRLGLASLTVLLGLMTVLSACSAPTPGPGAMGPKPAAMANPGIRPAAPAGIRPTPTAAVKPAATDAAQGSLIARASEILAAGANPFLNKLPKPKIEVPEISSDGTDVPMGPVANAFENFQLLGVVVKGAHSMALLSLGSDVGTEMVRAGDQFFANGMPFKVKRIGQNEVDLEKGGAAPELRTLGLPSIVGYGGDGQTGGGVSLSSPNAGASAGTILQLEEL